MYNGGVKEKTGTVVSVKKRRMEVDTKAFRTGPPPPGSTVKAVRDPDKHA